MITATPLPTLTAEQVDRRRQIKHDREAQAVADRDILGPLESHVGEPRRCQRCAARVFVYATTPDGTRAYCRCVRAAR